MTGPLVSCLMPTANRRSWAPRAIDAFLRQDYGPRELVILDDGLDPIGDLIPDDPRIRYVRCPAVRSLGEKRNQTCRLAQGDILVNWDDDDWSAPCRLSYQVGELQARAADVCGLDRLWFHDQDRDLAWRYRCPRGRTPWLAGSTLCFQRRLWERHPFPDIGCGEDTLWIATAVGARVLPLARDDFFVASVHPGNTSPKPTDCCRWIRTDPAALRALVGDSPLTKRQASTPLVSCILLTGGRRPFVSLSIACFLAQGYDGKELVVVDDGPEPIDDLLAGVSNVRYVRTEQRRTIGAKRNLGCEAASGEVLVQWDDDDWHGPERLSRQVAPLIDGRAELTALETRWIAQLPEAEFWTLSPALHRRMFYCDVHGGTLAYRREVWTAGVRYPEIDLAEDSAFLHAALQRGNRLLRLANEGLFVYVRHGANAWRFPAGAYLDPRGWGRTRPPDGFGTNILFEYQNAARQLAQR